jgi:hypothetical protein
MAKDELGYDKIVERQLRGVAREVLTQVAAQGLPGDHHFYISFRTDHPDTSVGANLKAQFPHEITIVLQHQFWGLEITENAFEVTLSFGGKHERLHVPFEALVSFSDPSVKFGLQFEPKGQQGEVQPRGEAAAKPAEAPIALPKSKPETPAGAAASSGAAGNTLEDSSDRAGTVIALDTFRKKH